MSTTTQTENFVAKEIFSQLNASRVNGFPFFAYTGVTPQIFTATELYLKVPRNPGKVANVMISHNVMDTYDIIINGKKGLISRYEDIYADAMVDLIVRVMGVL